MPLNFKDFTPQSTGFFSNESPEAVLVRVNTWIAENQVRVVNVETLLQGGGDFSVRFQGFRVWADQGARS